MALPRHQFPMVPAEGSGGVLASQESGHVGTDWILGNLLIAPFLMPMIDREAAVVPAESEPWHVKVQR